MVSGMFTDPKYRMQSNIPSKFKPHAKSSNTCAKVIPKKRPNPIAESNIETRSPLKRNRKQKNNEFQNNSWML